MYINDLPNCTTFNTVLYADDTYLCLSDKNLNNLQLAVNSELPKVDRWMRLNKLPINNSKTSYMLTSMYRFCMRFHLYIFFTMFCVHSFFCFLFIMSI